MRHTYSLKRNNDFRSMYARGKNSAGVYLAIYSRRNRLGYTRLGLTVSTKLGGAVTRNRIRRRIKEAYRLTEAKYLPGMDLVIVARSKALNCKFTALQAEMTALLTKLGAVASAQDISNTPKKPQGATADSSKTDCGTSSGLKQ